MDVPLLPVKGVTVSFDGFRALDNLSPFVMPSPVQVVIGPNGVGKSTLTVEETLIAAAERDRG